MQIKRFQFLKLRDVDVPSQFKSTLEHQRRRDLVLRQQPGVGFLCAIYGLVFVSILVSSSTVEKFLWLVAFGVLLGLSIFFLYSSVKQYSICLSEGSEEGWVQWHVSIFLVALSGGLLLLASLMPTPLQHHFPIILCSTIGLSAGAALSLCIRREMVWIFIFGIVAPAVLGSFSGYSVQTPAMGILFIVFSLGMVGVAAMQRYEYEQFVVSNLKLSEQTENLAELSSIDWLTGVKNRRYFDEVIREEFSRSNRIGYPISLLMIDIDHFKQVNDTYGHLAGDSCLESLASVLQKSLNRVTDTLARYGGEEFCILLPGIDDEESMRFAEQLRSEVLESVTWHLQTPITLTISIGGATAGVEHLFKPTELIAHADEALYEAKKRGRNRVFWHKNGALEPSISYIVAK